MLENPAHQDEMKMPTTTMHNIYGAVFRSQLTQSINPIPTSPMPLSASTLGFLAAAFNFCMLAFNVGFTRADAIATLDPEMFSLFGQLMILVWAVVFAAAGSSNAAWPVWLAFALEKMVYVVGWVRWHKSHDAVALIRSAVASDDHLDLLAPVFHTLYGGGDLVFAVLFLLHAGSTTAPLSKKKQ